MHRAGNVLTGPSVSLLAISAPIRRQATAEPSSRRAHPAGPRAPRPSRRCSAARRAAAARGRRAGPVARTPTRRRRRSTTTARPAATCSDGPWLFRLDHGSVGLDAALPAPDRDRRLAAGRPSPTPGTRPTRAVGQLPRHGRPGIARTSACRRAAARLDLARALRVGQLPLAVWLNGTPIGRNAGAYLPFELRAARPAPEARRGQPPRRSGRQPPPARPTSRPSGLTGDGRPGRRLVELRRAAARGLPRSASTASTSTPSRCARDLPCATLRGDASTARVDRCATTAAEPTRVQLDRPLRRPSPARPRHAPRRRRRRRDASRHACASPTRGLWSPAQPVPLPASRSASRAGGGPRRPRYDLQSGIRSIKVVRRAPAAQRPAAELPRRRPPRGRPAATGFAIDNARRDRDHAPRPRISARR